MAKGDRVLAELPVFRQGKREWRGLRVEGLVSTPLLLSLEELQALPQQRLVEEFRCEEGWVAPAQEWEGVPLLEVLRRAKPEGQARHVACSEGSFTIGLTLDEALAPGALLALRLNGQPLPVEHGGPCRLVVAGTACYYSIKGVDRLEVTAAPPEPTARAIAQSRIAARTGRGQGAPGAAR